MTIKKGNIAEKIGFIQGRLSKTENNRIQVFPVKNWKIEFQVASVNNINKIEWTIDSETISDNPLINSETITEPSVPAIKVTGTISNVCVSPMYPAYSTPNLAPIKIVGNPKIDVSINEALIKDLLSLRCL